MTTQCDVLRPPGSAGQGYVDRVEIACRDEIIAIHPRSYETADFVYNPLHYLALLEHKTKALDQAAPLDGWQLVLASTACAG